MRAMLVTEFRAITRRWRRYCSLEATEDTWFEPHTNPTEEGDNIEVEEESLVDFLEPENPLEKRIFNEFLLNNYDRKETAKDMGFSYSTLVLRGAKLKEKLKEKMKDSKYKNLIKEN